MLTITLPWLDTSLMTNRRSGRHWTTFQAAKVRARQDGFYAAKQVARGFESTNARLPMKVTFVQPDATVRRDWDGLSGAFKHYQDGIAKALDVDDSQFWPVMLDKAIDKVGRGFVLVEIGL